MVGRLRAAARRSTLRILAVASVATLIVLVVQAAPASAVPEPTWPSRCPLKVALLVDRSESMEQSFGEVQSGSSDLVDALRGQHTQVMVIGFGSSASVEQPLTDVAEPDGRARVKSVIRDLDTLSGNLGGTNWDEALRLASGYGLSVAVMLSDGDPTTSQAPASQTATTLAERGRVALEAAEQSADRLKRSGTRVVPVGIGTPAASEAHLAAISGPAAGDDYYVTGIDQLRHQLYDIAAKSCGIPIAALPTPEPPGFPLKQVLIGALLLLCAVTAIGALRHWLATGRQPSQPPCTTPRLAPVRRERPITVEGVTGGSRGVTGGSRVAQTSVGAATDVDAATAPSRAGRSMSLEFLRKPGDPPAPGRPDERR